MRTVTVNLGERSYPVHVGPGLLERGELFVPHLAGSQVMLVTNDTVAARYAGALERALAATELHRVLLPDGERFKTLAVVERVFDALLENGCGRDVTVLALGGGVVGDMAGFAAACYQRGVAYVQVPTTLLAQVDSSVGGKTGVNHRLGKNMIGAFHQPRLVIADTDTLSTLPPREFRAGLAEVVKYGLIRDPGFFAWLEHNATRLRSLDPGALVHAVERSVHNKAEVVAADEREGGVRALLNLGHTFGHAIETATDYCVLLHGEAVAIGMVMAADLSRRLGWLDDDRVERIRALLHAFDLPSTPPAGIPPQRLRELMAVDKKVRGGRVRLVLLRDIGEAVVTGEFDPRALAATLGEG